MRSFLMRPQLELYKKEACGLWTFMYQEGKDHYGYRFGTGETLEEKEHFHNGPKQSQTETVSH